MAASALDTIASVLTLIPDFELDLMFWGLGGSSTIFGGVKLADVSKIAAGVLQTVSAWEQDQAGMASRTASYERRVDDWILQSNLAARELMQIGQQIITSLIREQITHHEYRNHKRQIEQAQEIEQFLQEKFTNEELYAWMQGELSKLYYEYYKFAFDIARKAEQTMKHELMRPELDNMNFIVKTVVLLIISVRSSLLLLAMPKMIVECLKLTYETNVFYPLRVREQKVPGS